MTESLTTCPCGCGQRQDAGLLAASCTERLERELGDVRAIVDELNVTISKQARIGASSGKPGLASERSPVNFGAITVADNLTNVLTTWARDVFQVSIIERESMPLLSGEPSVMASRILLAHMDAVRRHPAVAEMVDEIEDAISHAREIVDRPADRVYVGPCIQVAEREFGQMAECGEELWAKPDATTVKCRTCGETTDVGVQREAMMERAKDRLFTVREASTYVGSNGNKDVTQEWIWRQIHGKRKRLAYRPGTKLIRLGDLMAILSDDRDKADAA